MYARPYNVRTLHSPLYTAVWRWHAGGTGARVSDVRGGSTQGTPASMLRRSPLKTGQVFLLTFYGNSPVAASKVQGP